MARGMPLAATRTTASKVQASRAPYRPSPSLMQPASTWHASVTLTGVLPRVCRTMRQESWVGAAVGEPSAWMLGETVGIGVGSRVVGAPVGAMKTTAMHQHNSGA